MFNIRTRSFWDKRGGRGAYARRRRRLQEKGPVGKYCFPDRGKKDWFPHGRGGRMKRSSHKKGRSNQDGSLAQRRKRTDHRKWQKLKKLKRPLPE